MSPTLDEQIEGLKNTIAEMEAQRPALGDEVVDAALAPLQRKLDELVAMLGVQKATKPTGPPQQRKLVTLLFMDIAGSTAIAQDMDPEDVREVFDIALKHLAEPVEAHGGRVTRFMGDGFLAVFGAPMAREDDPERAIRAGLSIIETCQELAPEIEADWDIPGFQVRVGINTGLVALGGLTEAEDTLMGAAVNLAARLESAATAGGLLISHDTYRHVRGLFDVELQEPIQAKGFDEPVQVYRVLRARARAFRTYTRGVEGVETRMVGRHDELKYLQDALLTAIEEGEGQLVTVSGEAGVGKSRLLYEFQNWIELLPPPAVRFFEGRGRQEAQGLPYGLLRDLFEFRFQVQEDDSGEVTRQKFEAGFEDAFDEGWEAGMRAHILGQLLGFDFSDSPHLQGVLRDAEQLRNRGLMYLAEYFRGLCAQGPVVVFLEDIHWADDSSLDALNWLGERLQKQRLLILCAARPTLFERRPYWGEGQTYHTRLDLRPLSKRESRQLVAEIFKFADHLPNELRELVVEGAEGNPFYVEELVKMLVEDGVIDKGEVAWQVHTERLAQLEVPPTLAGVLQARLDSLPAEERTVLQQASVVGRQFWDRVVSHIQAAGDGAPQFVPETLTALRGRELIYRREVSAFAGAREYLFKHDILREVTYESVLKRLRRRYHGLVADWLITQSAERAGEYSGLIAGHLLRASRKEEACDYFIQAAKAALESYANTEAEAYFRKALGLSPSKSQRATCLAGLGEALGRQGHTDEAVQNLRQAIGLYHEMGEYDWVAHLYARLSKVLFHDDYQKAWDACLEGLDLMESAADSPGYARLLAEAGRVAFFVKASDQVIPLCQRAIEMAESMGNLEVVADAKITLALHDDNPEEGLNILLEVVELAESNNMLEIAERAYLNLGSRYTEMMAYSASISCSKRGVEIGKQLNTNYLYGIANLIEAYIGSGKLDDAHNLLATIPQINAPKLEKEILTLLNQGRILYARGEWNTALEFIKKFLDIARQGGSVQLIANRNIELATIIIELDRFGVPGNLDNAETALRENLELRHRTSDSCCLLGTVFARQGRFQDAHDWLNQTSSQYLTKLEESYRLQTEGELALAEQRWDEAVAVCESSISLYKSCGHRWEWARRLIDLGDVLTGRDGPGDRQRAGEVYQQSLEMFTEMGAPGYVKVLEERLRGI